MSLAEHRLLVLAPTGRDAAVACRLLEAAGVSAVACRDVDELCERYREGAAGMLLADEALTRRALGVLAALLVEQESWSDLPIVVFAATGGDQATLAARHAGLMVPLGNVTLLDRPIRPVALVSAARAALRARTRQYAAREVLGEQARAVAHRDQFLAMLGHELRNPLGAIQLAVEMVERQGEAGRWTPLLRRQSQHLARLVDDLLDVARVTTGKITLSRTRLDLRGLVSRSLQAMQDSIKERGLAVTVALPDAPVPVNVDPVRIEQVLANLVTNAIKYTGHDGRIRIELNCRGGMAELAVHDTGAGIAADMLGRIFELFAQVDSTLDRAKGGMGIGLTLVRRLVELHGGSVEARSPGPGQGSTFLVQLPLVSGLPAREVVPTEPGERPRFGYRIVIVEDHPDSRALLQGILEHAGYQVVSAADGPTAVDVATREHPQVMVVDIGLPGLDGYGVARAVRAALGAQVFLVALTGYGQPEDRLRALEAGFDVHLTKPVDARALLGLLDGAHDRQASP